MMLRFSASTSWAPEYPAGSSASAADAFFIAPSTAAFVSATGGTATSVGSAVESPIAPPAGSTGAMAVVSVVPGSMATVRRPSMR